MTEKFIGTSAVVSDLDDNFNQQIFRQSGADYSLAERYKRHLIIPVHPPRYGLLANAFAALAKTDGAQDVLLTIVATSDVECEMFRNYAEVSKLEFPFDHEVISAMGVSRDFGLPNCIDMIVENRDNSIINIKKMVAIYRALCLGAEELCVIDSDVIFRRDLSTVFDQLSANYDKRQVISGHVDLAAGIIHSTSAFLTEEDRQKIIRMTDDAKLYSWFFDAPFYRRPEALGWFAYMMRQYGTMDNALSHMSWGTFEHMIFQYYCLLHEDFEIVDIRPMTGERVPDELWLSEVFEVIDRTGYCPVWATLGGMISYINPAQMERALGEFSIALHVDRVPARID